MEGMEKSSKKKPQPKELNMAQPKGLNTAQPKGLNMPKKEKLVPLAEYKPIPKFGSGCQSC